MVCLCGNSECPCTTLQEKVYKLERFLHSTLSHPDYNYTTTTGLKRNFNPIIPPGADWKQNIDYNKGQLVFKHHEEAYWRKKL